MKLSTRVAFTLLIAVAGLGAVVFFFVRANMQNIVKQPNRDRKENVLTALPPMIRPEIVIRKRDRVLEVFDEGRLIKSYTIVLGFAPEGDKEIEGDGKTPEGEFYLFTKNAVSKFHLSLGVSYPSIDDAKRGLDAGIISKAEHREIVNAIEKKKAPPQKTALGGEIYIHGGGTGGDWTLGCVAMKNEEIEELFNAVPVGAKITILP
jgi:murein L,D-transpeptidase YafK